MFHAMTVAPKVDRAAQSIGHKIKSDYSTRSPLTPLCEISGALEPVGLGVTVDEEKLELFEARHKADGDSQFHSKRA